MHPARPFGPPTPEVLRAFRPEPLCDLLLQMTTRIMLTKRPFYLTFQLITHTGVDNDIIIQTSTTPRSVSVFRIHHAVSHILTSVHALPVVLVQPFSMDRDEPLVDCTLPGHDWIFRTAIVPLHTRRPLSHDWPGLNRIHRLAGGLC